MTRSKRRCSSSPARAPRNIASSSAAARRTQAPAEYTAFVLRRDGQAAVLTRSRDGASTPVAWRPHDAIAAHTGGTDPVKNILRLDVDPASVMLSVNGTKVLDVPRASVRSSGLVGFRVGKDLNLHITSLDVTRRYAPQPTRQPKPSPPQPSIFDKVSMRHGHRRTEGRGPADLVAVAEVCHAGRL